MFNEEEIEAYKSIQAPLELKISLERDLEIGTKKKIKKRNYMYILPVAAILCMLLILSFRGLTTQNQMEIYVNGTEVTSDGISIDGLERYEKAARMTNYTVRIPFEIAEKDVVLKPEEGTIQEEENGSFCWTVEDANQSSNYTLTIEKRKKTYHMILQFEEENNCWTVCLEQ